MKTLIAAAVTFTAVISLQAPQATSILVPTELGEFPIDVDPQRAPATVVNFLRHVDAGHYDGGGFHRTVTMANQPNDAVRIEVIQAGVNPTGAGERGGR